MYVLKQLKTVVLKTQFKCVVHYLYTLMKKAYGKFISQYFLKQFLLEKNRFIQTWT